MNVYGARYSDYSLKQNDLARQVVGVNVGDSGPCCVCVPSFES